MKLFYKIETIVLGSISFFIFLIGVFSSTPENSSLLGAFFGIALLWLGFFIYRSVQYDSSQNASQFTSPMYSFTFISNPVPLTMFKTLCKVYSAGGTYFPMAKETNEGTFIVPACAIEEKGDNHLSPVIFRKIDFNRLHPKDKVELLKTGFNMDELYLGLFSDYQLSAGYKAELLLDSLMDIHEELNFSKKFMSESRNKSLGALQLVKKSWEQKKMAESPQISPN